ncbi:hypothetical protein E1193_18025 [Micromonospora sp. KC606]|uniref:hypothetical protein n=1 Tax=Micromonospora sp. KC606 TaxID=2530379 RepID=UPI001044FAE0|nr:hypothetical protein [Micromonospora sp. KC606]TDC80136.1 hypothetical protein E1193_18025 [Micromonospora sp. KC606]
MSYRDWERGEGSPRERQSITSWDDPGEPVPAGPYTSRAERRRTPSRRRAIERGHEEPSDPYLPRWAVESGIAHADGRGRHAAPDDDDDDRAVSRPGRRAAGRRSERPLGELPAIGAAAGMDDHTREWTFDRPQEQGYVGSRRAQDDVEDAPVSGGSPTARPRRSASRRPQVIWSGLEESEGGSDADEREPDRPTRRSRRASDRSSPRPADSWRRAKPTSDTWSRAELTSDPWGRAEPAADPWSQAEPTTGSWSQAEPTTDSWSQAEPTTDSWSQAAEAEPEYRPAVDPWDASGVHTWQRSGEDRWGQPGAAGWEDSTAQWDRFTDTAQWDRTAGGRRSRNADAGSWDEGGTERGDRADAPRSVEPTTGEGFPWSAQPETFWSGTRLAEDDPRWVDPPASAPRSPAVTYTAPRPRAAPRRRAATVAPVAAPSWRDRIESVGGGGWTRRLEDDLLDPDPGGPLRPLVLTAACYVVPAVLVFLWMLTLSGQVPAGCVTDISGGGCDSPRAQVLGSLLSGAPRYGLAFMSSLVVAGLLRRVGTTWRPATVALAAAVVGGGLSTVMISAVTGQPIG